MHFKIDSRESSEKLFDAFDILVAEKGISYEKTFLEVGDIVCGNVVIERKEAGDFVGSIMDGRLTDQAHQMCLNFEHKYVIIEGNPFRTRSSINENAIIGKMTSLYVKYNIPVMFVENQAQLAYASYSLITKHMDGASYNPEDFVKLKHKVSDEEILVAMLHQIPNLGYDKAQAIAELYNFSLKEFVNSANPGRLKTIDGVGTTMSKKIMKLIE